MKEALGDLWTFEDPDAVAITTNGYVRSDGRAVMGRGCAAEATRRYNGIERIMGRAIKNYGNIPALIIPHPAQPILLSFPVKPSEVVFDGSNLVPHMRDKYSAGDVVPGWAALADLNLILSSSEKLRVLCNSLRLLRINIPRAGCGAGGLDWGVVGPLLHKILDDRFTSITSGRSPVTA